MSVSEFGKVSTWLATKLKRPNQRGARFRPSFEDLEERVLLTGTGLTGQYFSDQTLTNAVLTRTDATVNFDWGTGSPDASVPVDHFSARWTGQVQAQVSETYTFYTGSDDGVRLWVNGQQLINNWTDHAPTENSGTIALVAGQMYDIKMEFYENGGGAVAQLFWSSPSTAKQAVPTSQLYGAGSAASTSVDLTTAFNRTGIVSDGSTFGGGLDTGGSALSANLLGSSVNWNGNTFNLGTPNSNDVISTAGQTINLPAGNFTTLNFLATSVNGNQANQAFTVAYTDGTIQTFTQSISDWYTPQNYSGESKVATMAYRDVYNGTKDNRTFYVFGYSVALNSSKTVKSITLPNNGNVEILAVTLAGSPSTVTAPSLTTQPTSQTVNAGGAATFSVTATGTGPLSYQWQKLVSGSWTNISGATLATYTIGSAQAADAGSYRVSVANSAGSVTSSTVSLTVNPVVGNSLQDAGFEAPNVGTGTYWAFQYDPSGVAWNFSGNAGVAGNGSGFTSGNPNAPEGTQVGFLQMSGSFSQTVNLAAGSYQITFQAAQRGNYGGAQSFKVLVDGQGVGTFSGLSTAYASYTTSPFTVAAGNHTITFQGLDPDGGDDTAFIDQVSVNVASSVTAPTITSQPTSQTVNASQSATFSVTATGTGSLSYQWQKLVSGTWTNISGATTSTFSISSAQAADAGQYQAVVANSAGQVVSNTVSLTVNSVAVVGTGTGLTGQYFNDMTLTNAVLTRTDATVNYDWGGGSPDASVPADHFSARWTGQVQAQFSETYTFYTVSDDGVRLWVNGQLIIDNWADHAPTENGGTIALVAGQKYDIKMEFYENGGGAVAKLFWSSPSTAKQAVPTSQLYSASVAVVGTGTGLTGQYFSDQNLTNAVLTRTDASVNFDWGGGAPDASVPADHFSARWTGQVQAQFSQTYTFYTESDDGVRLWVNGQLIIDNWTDHAPSENSATLALVAGQKYDIKMEYYENGGGATAQLLWNSASTAKQAVPTSQLYVVSTPAPAAPTGLTATAGDGQVALFWSASTGATSYNVYRWNGSGWAVLKNVSGTSTSDTGLTNGTTYYYEVSAVNSGGESGLTNYVTVTPKATVPATPTNLTATAGDGQVALSWSASTGATSYNVYRWNGSGWAVLKNVSGTSTSDTGLTNGTTYYYEVSAVNSGGESGLTNYVTVTPKAVVIAPAAPTGLTATAGDGQVALSWSASTGATSYNVYRWNGSSYALIQNVGGTTTTDTGLTNGTTYWYEVTAVNAGGESGPSNQVSAMPAGAVSIVTQPAGSTVSGTSANLQVSATDSSGGGDLTYTWSAISGPAAVTFTANGTHNANNTTVNFSAAGVYQFQVVVSNGVNTATSNSATITVNQTLTSLSISPASATVYDGSAVFFTASGLDQFGASETTSYVLWWVNGRFTGPVYIAPSSGSGTDTIKAVATGGPADGSVQVTAQTTISYQPAPLAPPAGLAATGANAQVVLTWTAASGATSYNVYRSTVSGNEELYQSGITTTSWTDSGLKPTNTAYYYAVQSVNSSGNGPLSGEVSAPLTAPAAPTNLSATPGSGTVSLSWTAAAGAGSYNVYYSTSSGTEHLYQSGISGTTWTVTGLSNGTTYYFKVTASNSAGQGGLSAEVSAIPSSGNDWFALNIPDVGLQTLARTDLSDGSITYSDMLGLLNQAVSEGTVTTTILTSLQALVSSSGATYLNMPASVQYLGNALVGSLSVGATATQEQALVNQWFLGAVHPALDTPATGYALASSTLFGGSGVPLYTDISQGALNDCWLMASLAETAYKAPGIIEASFTDNGLQMANGVQVHVWTLCYYPGATAKYLTLDNYLPVDGSGFCFANSNVMWAALWEKAFAVMSGGYAHLQGGAAIGALPNIAGGTAGTLPFGAALADIGQTAYTRAVNSSTTLLTVGSFTTDFGFVSGHDYAVLWCTGSGSSATYQLYNPWGTQQPQAVTWAQITQAGNLLQADGDEIVGAALNAGTGIDTVENSWGFTHQLTWSQMAANLLSTDATMPVGAGPAGNDRFTSALSDVGTSQAGLDSPLAFPAAPLPQARTNRYLSTASFAGGGEDQAHGMSLGLSAYAVSRHAPVEALEFLDYGSSLVELDVFAAAGRKKW